MPIISIVVPVYKVEKYLAKCIDSILAQTFTDFELILVDDGSPDQCGEICEEYAGKDSRIVVLHRLNGGQGAARNQALDIARGDYIGFVDSDDFIASNMYECLYKNLVKYNAQMATCGYYDMFEETGRVVPHCKEIVCNVCTPEQVTEAALYGIYACIAPWSKLYCRRLFDNIRFPEDKFAEDAFIIIDLILCCSIIVLDTTPSYYYLVRTGSSTTEDFHAKMIDVIEAKERNLEIIDSEFPQCHAAGIYCLACSYRTMLTKLAVCSREVRAQNSRLIKRSILYTRKNIVSLLLSKYSNIKQKIAFVLICLGASFYFFACAVMSYEKEIESNG